MIQVNRSFNYYFYQGMPRFTDYGQILFLGMLGLMLYPTVKECEFLPFFFSKPSPGKLELVPAPKILRHDLMSKCALS